MLRYPTFPDTAMVQCIMRFSSLVVSVVLVCESVCVCLQIVCLLCFYGLMPEIN